MTDPNGETPATRTSSVKLARQIAVYAAAGAFAKAAALLAVPYLTRLLGPGQYGLVDLAASFAGLLVILVRFTGDLPTMRMAAGVGQIERGRAYSAFVAATALGSAIAVALLVPVAELVARGLWDAPNSAGLAVAAIALVPVNAVQTALANVLRFVERPKSFAAVAGIDVAAQLTLAVIFAAAGFGATGVLLGYVFGGLVGLVATALAARPYMSGAVDAALMRRLVAEGIPFLPGAVAFVFADTIARTLAANTLGVAAVGQLALAIRVSSVMALAAGAFSSAWGPYGLGLSPSPETRLLLDKAARAVLSAAAVIAIAIGALAPEVTVVIGGAQFEEASAAVPGLLLAGGITAWAYVLTTAAGISYRGAWVAWSTLLGAGVQVGVIAIALPLFGISGFAVGSVIGRLAGAAILGWAVADVAPMSLRSMAVLGIATAATFWIQMLNEQPAETLGVRLLVFTTVAVTGAMAVFPQVRGLMWRR